MTSPKWPGSDDGNRVARWLVWRLLRFAEWLVLRVYGWKCNPEKTLDAEDAWLCPEGHPKRLAPRSFAQSIAQSQGFLEETGYDHDHAMNSTKFYARQRTPRGMERIQRRRSGGF